MANGEKTSKLKEFKEIISSAVEIMRQVRTPGVRESVGEITDAAVIAKSIIEDLKTPAMVKNIENFRLILENMNEASTKMQDALKQIESTGVINEAKEFVKSAKSTIDLFGYSGQDMRETSTAIKEIFKAIRATQDTIHNVREVYSRTRRTPNEIVVGPEETEEFLKDGWQYLGTLPNGKVIIKKIA